MLGACVARSNFLTVVGKRTSFDVLLNFFKKQFCRPPTVICLTERAADNLINFQAVVKKRLSKFELLKYCRNFPPAVTDRLRKQQRAIQVLKRIIVLAQNELLCSRALRLQRSLRYSFARKVMIIFRHAGTHRVSVYCGSQAVKHYSYAILLSPIQTPATYN